MRQLFILFLIFITADTFAQTNGDIEVKTLRGTWVKTTNAPDTLKFSLLKHLDNCFELKLATRPATKREGLFEFRTLMMVMMIHWMPSSNAFDCPTVKYFFDKSGQLFIDNFYSADNEDKVLIFKKIN
jgi:hypothetical protein